MSYRDDTGFDQPIGSIQSVHLLERSEDDDGTSLSGLFISLRAP